MIVKKSRGFKRTSPKKTRKALKSNIRSIQPKRYRPERPVLNLRGRTTRRNSYWYKCLLFQAEAIDCGICEQPIKDIADLTIDHIVPLSRGGSNSKENLQPAHLACNRLKGNKFPFVL